MFRERERERNREKEEERILEWWVSCKHMVEYCLLFNVIISLYI